MMSSKRRHSRPLPLNLRSFSNGILETSECTDFAPTTTTDSSLMSRSTIYSTSSPIPSPSSSRPSSPRGNLALLASRRSSRDSQGTTATADGDESTSPVPSLRGYRRRNAARRPSNFLELPAVNYLRPRVCSLPEGSYNPRTGLRDNIYRLRKFSITNKGVVNCGDKIIPQRSSSNNSVASLSNSRSQSNLNEERSPNDGSYGGESSTAVSSDDEANENNKLDKFRIVLLGAAGVGKSSLLTQFMTSEYINTYDASLDDQFGERNVLVNLEEKESELVFIDHPTSEMSVENSIATYEPHAAIVVYSVTDRTSFRAASDILRYLWQEGFTQEKAVILVGNKCDLARARVTTSHEGKSLACAHDCKFIETSSGIQHNVDELLVGILKQCRLRAEKFTNTKLVRENNSLKKNGRKKSIYSSKTSLSLHLAKEILGKLCLQSSKAKSCENLHVL